MNKVYKCLNLIFFVAMIIVNFIGNYLPMGNSNITKISNNYTSLFTPHPVTSTIWVVIYILLLVFVIYQLDLGSYEMDSDEIVRDFGPAFIISCIANMGWIICFKYNRIIFALIFMVILLITLAVISSKTVRFSNETFLDNLSRVGFDLYLGWVCIMTIENISVLLVKIQWNRFGLTDQFWTVVAIVISFIIGLVLIIGRAKYYSAISIIVGFLGIMIKHISKKGYYGEYPIIIAVSAVGIIALIIIMIIKRYSLRAV